MTIGIFWDNLRASGNTEVTHDGLRQDDGLVTLVLICLFTDARADVDDVLPDDSGDPRGWPGDSFSAQAWGSRLWLLDREKLTDSVRQRVEDYSRQAMEPLLRWGYVRSATVQATIVSLDRINFIITLTRPDLSVLRVDISKRWGATVNAI
ncbi:TPA: phage GP46 family protein [Citrobacter amalonaticus]